MSFRNRLTLAAAVAVAVAVAMSSAVIYLAARRELTNQVDEGLTQRVRALSADDLQPSHYVRPPLGGPGGYAQIVDVQGSAILLQQEDITIPVTPQAKMVAAGRSGTYFSDMSVKGIRVRVLTSPLLPGLALQVARPLNEVDTVLRRLGILLAIIAAAGIALAAALGRAVARAALVPVHRLTEGAEKVAQTHSLAQRIDAGGADDEIGRLAASFNSMLDALDGSIKSQRQLVADASHELRTPLTSLRTNIEVLARAEALPEADRRQLLQDLKSQMEELSALVGDLIDLARGDEPDIGEEEVRFDLLVQRAVDRMQSYWPKVRFVTDLEPCLVKGVPSRLDRAVANLLDNAGKWSPPDATVEVMLSAGRLTVRDHGQGINGSDLPFIFDRFYRAPGARALPGSGLGLAIVRRVAESHAGTVHAEAAEGGGTVLRLELAVVPFSPEPPQGAAEVAGPPDSQVLLKPASAASHTDRFS